MNIKQLTNFLIKYEQDIIQNSNNIIQNLNNLRNTYGGFNANNFKILQDYIESINENTLKVREKFTDLESTQLTEFNYLDWYSSNSAKKTEELVGDLLENINNADAIFSRLQNEFQQSLNFVNQLKSILPHSIKANTSSYETETIIEIIFNGKTDINNLVDAKEQINDWYLIILGYANYNGIRIEDIDIIAASKESPFRLKLKTTLEIAAAFITISVGLLELEKRFLKERNNVDYLKATEIVDNVEKEKMVKIFEDALEKSVSEEMKKFREKLINNESNKLKDEDNSSLDKALNTQYKFIINGGEVKIFLPENNEASEVLKQDVKKLNSIKQEIKQIGESIDKIKLISDTN